MDLITKRFSTLSTQIAFYNPYSPIYTFYPMLLNTWSSDSFTFYKFTQPPLKNLNSRVNIVKCVTKP